MQKTTSMKKNNVFIATSIDGFIADENGNIDWLHSIPNPKGDDMGYSQFISNIDALIMGRNTFETICGFDIEWPYDKPVFVLSRSLHQIPKKFQNNAQLIKGDLKEVVKKINGMGHSNLYIDGGTTIQSFLKEDLIDEMTITLIPVLLGKGIPLFSNLNGPLGFECFETKLFLGKVVQNSFKRKR